MAGDEWWESDQALCLCGRDPDIPGLPVTAEDDCPAHTATCEKRQV